MRKPRRGDDGRWEATVFCYIDDKGYPRICAGPLRGQRLHRIIAAAKLGRPLTKDEDVHHVDGDKFNFAPENLKVMGHKEHGCVSAKQHRYVKEHDIHLEAEWNEYHDRGGADVAFP